MSNYRLTIRKGRASLNPWNIDLHRWYWSLDRKDNTIGYTDSGESYTHLGAYLKARYRLWKVNRPTTKKEYEL